jgi:hypothetical protein
MKINYECLQTNPGWWCYNHLEKFEFVNGKDDNPYMKWKIKAMFQTTNLNLSTCTEKIFPCFEENSWKEGIRVFRNMPQDRYLAGSVSPGNMAVSMVPWWMSHSPSVSRNFSSGAHV